MFPPVFPLRRQTVCESVRVVCDTADHLDFISGSLCRSKVESRRVKTVSSVLSDAKTCVSDRL